MANEAAGGGGAGGGGGGGGSKSDSVTVEMHDLGSKIEFYLNGSYRGESSPGVKLPSANHAGFVLTGDAQATKVHVHFSNFGIRSL